MIMDALFRWLLFINVHNRTNMEVTFIIFHEEVDLFLCSNFI